MENTERHNAFRVYILGHEAYVRPGYHLQYFGQPTGAGWVIANRFAKRLGIEVVLPLSEICRAPLPEYLKREPGWC